MAGYKFIGGDGNVYGPYSADQMRQLGAQSKLVASSQVSADSGPWLPASNFQELGIFGGHVGPGSAGAGTNGMAIAGMILGILSILSVWPCCGLPFNVLGLIFSAVALNQIKRNPHQQGKGMAKAGLVCSLIGLVLLLMLLILGVAGGFMETFQ
jgi:hypothetical protein